MAKSAVYGISSVTLAEPGINGSYPENWNNDGSFAFKAIVKDSLQYNDSASSDNDVEVEDSDDMYASLPSGAATKGFTMDTYDLSQEAYAALQQFETNDGWNTAPAKIVDLVKAVQIVTKKFDDFPSKTFQWARMKIKVTRAGTIGKSGFPNFHLEFKEQLNTNAKGEPISGHRWKETDAVSYSVVSITTGNPSTLGLLERTGTKENYSYAKTSDTSVQSNKTYYRKD